MSESESDQPIVARLARLEEREREVLQTLELIARREPAPPDSPRRKWDGVAAGIASFIGVVAVGIACYTAYVQRQQLRAQVWPYVAIWKSDVDLGLYITNHGTGPARVTAVRVKVDGVLQKKWSDVWKATGFTGDEVETSSVSGIVLPTGKDYPLIHPRGDEQNHAKLRTLFRSDHDPKVTICYCSVLDECWMSTNDPDADVRGCSIARNERFRD